MIKAAYLLGQHWREFCAPACAGVFLLWLGLCTAWMHARVTRKRR